MADRIHHGALTPSSGEAPPTSSGNGILALNPPEKPIPPPGTYVIQIAKDQIYRYPPPENARDYQKRTRKNPRRSCCCRCLYWTFLLLSLLLLLLLLAVTAGVLYLVFRPESPRYSISEIAVRGFNLSSRSAIAPEFDVAIRAQNPNNKIGIYYETGSSVIVYYSDVKLCNGSMPAFYQPTNNITIIQTALNGAKILLSSAVHSALVTEENQKKVPLSIKLKAPVKIKFGAVTTWKITVTVKCDVTVDSLTTSSKIVSSNCKNSVKLW